MVLHNGESGEEVSVAGLDEQAAPKHDNRDGSAARTAVTARPARPRRVDSILRAYLISVRPDCAPAPPLPEIGHGAPRAAMRQPRIPEPTISEALPPRNKPAVPSPSPLSPMPEHVPTIPALNAVRAAPGAPANQGRDQEAHRSAVTQPVLRAPQTRTDEVAVFDQPPILAGGSPSAVTAPPPDSAEADEPDEQEEERITAVYDLLYPESPPELARDRGVLVRVDGAASGRVVSIMNGADIGRGAQATLRLDEPGVSRKHARIIHERGVYVIEDLNSRNGTFVQGHSIRRAVLNEGDLVQFGALACFRFQVMDLAQESLMRRLYDSSTVDPLTGVSNRGHLDRRLRSELAFAVRHSTDLALIIFDIDDFKGVNDRFGHLAGDQVLNSVATTAQSTLRAEDLLARYGGEEFAILLRDTASAGAARVAERVQRVIAKQSTDIGKVSIRVTVSAGCAVLSECEEPTAKHLIELADGRLYAAKRARRERLRKQS